MIKQAKIDTNTLPIVYYKLVNYIREFVSKYPQGYQKYKRTNSFIIYNYNDIVNKSSVFTLDLNGWSGLDEWYKQLLKRKRQLLHNNPQIKNSVLNNLVLDPKLCLRNLSSETAKQIYQHFWDKDYNVQKELQQQNIAISENLTLVICDKADDIDETIRARYIEKYMTIFIGCEINKDNKIITPLKTFIAQLRHEFIHFLDHITALVLEKNLQTISQYTSTMPNNDQEIYTDYQRKLSPLKGDYSDNEYKEYEPTFQQTYQYLQQAIISMHTYHRHFFYYNVIQDKKIKTQLNDQSELFFCYLTNYNTRKNQFLTYDIIDKIKNIDENYANTLKQLFDYIIKSNNLDKNSFRALYNRSKKTYITSMQRLTKTFKDNGDFIKSKIADKVL